MDQVLRMAKTLGIPKWRTLRIKVTSEKVDAEMDYADAVEDSLSHAAATLAGRVKALDNVLVWMEQTEEALNE